MIIPKNIRKMVRDFMDPASPKLLKDPDDIFESFAINKSMGEVLVRQDWQRGNATSILDQIPNLQDSYNEEVLGDILEDLWTEPATDRTMKNQVFLALLILVNPILDIENYRAILGTLSEPEVRVIGHRLFWRHNPMAAEYIHQIPFRQDRNDLWRLFIDRSLSPSVTRHAVEKWLPNIFTRPTYVGPYDVVKHFGIPDTGMPELSFYPRLVKFAAGMVDDAARKKTLLRLAEEVEQGIENNESQTEIQERFYDGEINMSLADVQSQFFNLMETYDFQSSEEFPPRYQASYEYLAALSSFLVHVANLAPTRSSLVEQQADILRVLNAFQREFNLPKINQIMDRIF